MGSLSHPVRRQVGEVAAPLIHQLRGAVTNLRPEGSLNTLDGTGTWAYRLPWLFIFISCRR
jgi:hypothetical protein